MLRNTLSQITFFVELLHTIKQVYIFLLFLKNTTNTLSPVLIKVLKAILSVSLSCSNALIICDASEGVLFVVSHKLSKVFILKVCSEIIELVLTVEEEKLFFTMPNKLLLSVAVFNYRIG
ncbi:MAG: hypothetical protein COC06_05195 [Bacteroidales bacterium]|nr:MAG: hypothetical protein COC06_05195 [Bacteroidales bacterium]